jgi:hypothetical protein
MIKKINKKVLKAMKQFVLLTKEKKKKFGTPKKSSVRQKSSVRYGSVRYVKSSVREKVDARTVFSTKIFYLINNFLT